MSQAGFRDVSGVPVRFEDINVVRDAARFNCSPATLAMLIDSVKVREGVGFSASQLSTTPRQHLLKTGDYYPTTGQCMSAHMGTMKHQQINVTRDRLIVEQRFTSKRNPRLSGQINHAAIVELTDDGTLVVDLYDLKTVKWYSVTLIQKNIWKNHPDYAWQLNLCAAMMEEVRRDASALELSDGSFAERIRVRNLYLECVPADSSYSHEPEARKMGVPEHQKVLIQVERRSADETYATYEAALTERDRTITEGYAPICKERWTNAKIHDLRCKFFCDVKDECVALSAARRESHPLAPWNADATLGEDLAASLKETA